MEILVSILSEVYQLTDSGANLLSSLESFFEWVINIQIRLNECIFKQWN